ncbi:cytochrome P450 superfamily protein [Citrus sinensis]|uniref:Cytochrome P450 superfamily protein n=1 Tax=Citrus sinensis TaxID=2711 RepID=A0ACB8M5I3_CITSI|nr:cytochrome P450 superfamily protein [Citrus sinensis]
MREIFPGQWPVVTILTTLMFIFFVGKFLCSKRKNPEKISYKFPPGRRGWPLVGDSFNFYNAVAGSHPPSFVREQVKRDLVGKNGVITVQGEQHRKLHGIAANMMRLEKLKFHFLKDIQIVMLHTLKRFQENQVILLQDIAINLMVNQLLGVSSESEIDQMAQFFSDFVDGCLSVPVNFPGFTYHTAMKAREKIISKIKKTINEHRQKGSSESGDGLLGRLLDEESLPDESISDFIINLLFAGNETTAKTMLFAVYFLTQNPRAMKQLLEEQESLKRNSLEEEMLTWQDYKAMPFTQCVIDETLRIGGIAIWLIREAKEDVTYQDYVIPKGCSVIPFMSAVHLDENLYKDAITFNPWRWMDPENKMDSSEGRPDVLFPICSLGEWLSNSFDE